MNLDPIKGEAMLLDWRESARGGCVIVLQIADPDDLEPFRTMTLNKGKTAGQRLMYAFVEVDDQEEPKASPEPEKGGPRSVLAARWCKDPEFQDWAGAVASADEPFTESQAADWVRATCGVASRAEIDSDLEAFHKFEMFVRQPFMEHLREG